MNNINSMKHWLSTTLLLLLAIGLNAQVTLTAPTGDGQSNYQWFAGTGADAQVINGATTATFQAADAGVYFATYDVTSGCGGATNYSVVVNSCNDLANVVLNYGETSGTYTWYEDNVPTQNTGRTLEVRSSPTAKTYHAEIVLGNGSCLSELPKFTIINLQDCEALAAAELPVLSGGQAFLLGLGIFAFFMWTLGSGRLEGLF